MGGLGAPSHGTPSWVVCVLFPAPVRVEPAPEGAVSAGAGPPTLQVAVSEGDIYFLLLNCFYFLIKATSSDGQHENQPYHYYYVQLATAEEYKVVLSCCKTVFAICCQSSHFSSPPKVK